MIWCKWNNGDGCTNSDSVHYQGECYAVDEGKCLQFEQDWAHPKFCPTCKFNYGSDKCHECKPGTPSNYTPKPKQVRLDVKQEVSE